MTRRNVGQILLLVLLAFSAARFSAGATFTVFNTNDSGLGSLRQAILDANANPGLDTIVFAIRSGPQTIAPLSALPTITDRVAIDGTTQPGYAGQPLIELSGASAGAGADGLSITAGNSTVSALVINRFQAVFLGGGGNGISLSGAGNNVVKGCYIGINAAGTDVLSNSGDGVLITSSASNVIGAGEFDFPRGNLISGNSNGVRIVGTGSDNNTVTRNSIGSDVTQTIGLGNFSNGITILAGSNNRVVVANVIIGNQKDGIFVSGSAVGTTIVDNNIGSRLPTPAGNLGNGIQISGASGTVVQFNRVSTNGASGILIFSDATGTLLSGNRVSFNALNGVIVSGANGNTIGAGNLITSNGTNGVRLRSGASGNLVVGNFIGTDTMGASGLGNILEGVQVNDGATGNTIGGSGTAQNVICGNGSNGVLITDPATTNNVVKSNLIGITAGGLALPNANRGVSIESGASGNTIGGVAGGEANTIAFHSGAGVFVESGTGNAIRGNVISRNAGLGIDLAPAGVNANDPCDVDGGANLGQNYPVLLSASTVAGTTTIQSSLNSAASSSFTVDFYGTPRCDAQGLTAGTRYLGSTLVTTNGSCAATAQSSLSTPFPVRALTATATDAAGNTSEFSACLLVPAAFYTVTPCRVIDTRGAQGPYGGPALAAGAARVFVFGGQCGIPPSAKAVAVNFAVQPTGSGHLRVYAAGDVDPQTATINYSAGQTRANNAVVTSGQAADLAVFCQQASGSTHLVVDVTGYFE